MTGGRRWARHFSMTPIAVAGSGVELAGTRIAASANGAWTLWRVCTDPPAVLAG